MKFPHYKVRVFSKLFEGETSMNYYLLAQEGKLGVTEIALIVALVFLLVVLYIFPVSYTHLTLPTIYSV